MTELDKLTDILHVPAHVKERAAVIYRKALDNGLVRGRSISAIAAAVLYVACVLDDVKRTQKEIAEVANVTEVTLRNRNNDLKKALQLSI